MKSNATTKRQRPDELAGRRRQTDGPQLRDRKYGTTGEALRAGEEIYRNLVESTLDLIFIVDRRGTYTYVNPRFEKVTGYSMNELMGEPFTCLVAPEFVQSTLDRFRKGIRGEETGPYEAEIIHHDGRRIPVEFLVTTRHDATGVALGRFGIGRDITERRKADDALRRITADLEKAQELAHIGSWRYNAETKLSLWSEEMFRILLLESTHGRPFHIDPKTCIHPDDWRRFKRLTRAALKGKPYGTEVRIIRPNGSTGYLFTTGEAEYGKNGSIQGLFGTAQDITERKNIEKTLEDQREQLRVLSMQLSEAEEAERRRIARDLHDQVGQNLTVVGINLTILKDAIPDTCLQSMPLHLLEDSLKLVEQTTELTRSLMADLRPPDMDEYGLVASVRWYGKNFSARTGIDVIIEGDDIDPRPAPSIENNIFRIVQEVLTNTHKHAEATLAIITMGVSRGMLSLSITDNGIGFNLADRKKSDGHTGWGLMTMTERTEMIGGSFTIESKRGKGTKISVKVPL
ncbi:MAG: PAS domain S-box protein [Syntrophales bacterium]|jgi:two-component system sensor histidine kinase UhpB|nr:PAS domain S-box protein [Syntrophales bacterium]MCK9527373.1 PAS domain S-box protein [Syntrophales bacterium]MDX9921475.1 PAS domain S-box protein [Syntrophales bacterium]